MEPRSMGMGRGCCAGEAIEHSLQPAVCVGHAQKQQQKNVLDSYSIDTARWPRCESRMGDGRCGLCGCCAALHLHRLPWPV